MSFFLTDGPVKPYAWGSVTALAELLGRAPSGRLEAELWMGSHPAGPAQLLSEVGGAKDLRMLLEGEAGPALLGAQVRGSTGLPFLLKVLAIGQPLSLQAHPNLAQARAGFAREEESGLSLESPERNYRDPNHKPELLLALSPVEAVCGFREPEFMLRSLVELDLASPSSPLRHSVEQLSRLPPAQGIEQLFRALFAQSRDQVDRSVELVLARATGSGSDAGEATCSARKKWFRKLHAQHGADPGLLAFLLLELVTLAPGEALYVGPQKLHAYLSGTGVEIMASSDTVLRGGLTGKHVDVPELCAVLDFRPCAPQLVAPDLRELPFATLREWSGAEEFRLQRYELRGAEVLLPAPSMVLVIEGEIELCDASQIAALTRGGQAFCGADGPTVARGTGHFFCASLPTAG